MTCYKIMSIVVLALAMVACGNNPETLPPGEPPPAGIDPTHQPEPVPFVPTPTAGEAPDGGQDGPSAEAVVDVDLYETGASETIAIGESRDGLLADNIADNWIFEGTAGQQVTVTVQPGDEDFDVVVRIVGPDGALLEEMDARLKGEAESITLTLPGDGLYVVRVAPYAFLGGSYTLMLGG